MVAAVSQFRQIRQDYVLGTDAMVSELKESLKYLKSSPQDFERLLNAIIVTERVVRNHAIFKEEKLTALVSTGKEALQNQGLSYDEFACGIATVLSKGPSFYDRFFVYSIIPNYIQAKANQYISQYMEEIRTIRGSQEPDLSRIRKCQSILFDLSSCSCKVEQEGFDKELNEYLKAGKCIDVSYADEADVIDPIIGKFKDHQYFCYRKRVATAKKLELEKTAELEKQSPKNPWDRPYHEVVTLQKNAGQLEGAIAELEEIAATIQSLAELLENNKEMVIGYEKRSLKEVGHFLNVHRFFTVVGLISDGDKDNQLTHSLDEIEASIEEYTNRLPSELRLTPSDDVKLSFLKRVESIIADIEKTRGLPGINQAPPKDEQASLDVMTLPAAE